jgi:hypothetical protein
MILINVFAAAPSQRSLSFHYDLIFLPFLFVGTGFGIQSINKWYDRKIIFILGVALLFSGRWPGYRIWEEFPSQEKISDFSFLAKIHCNKDKIIAGSGRTLAHLARCPELARITFENDELKMIQNPHGNAFEPKDKIILNLDFPHELKYYQDHIKQVTTCSPSKRFCVIDLERIDE